MKISTTALVIGALFCANGVFAPPPVSLGGSAPVAQIPNAYSAYSAYGVGPVMPVAQSQSEAILNAKVAALEVKVAALEAKAAVPAAK